LLRQRVLQSIANKIGATPAQLALAWLLQRPDVAVIPKAADATHVDDNLSAANVLLDDATLAELDLAFPPPRRASSLRML
jgi:diketogulonate reductase-like aldo/keto reductase